MTSAEKQSKPPDLSIVIPLYNERENLVDLEETLQEHLGKLSQSYEIIFVDDGSQDGSAAVIQSLKCLNPQIRLIRFQSNAGQTAAFDAGFKAARGEVVVTMDADLQNSPADIPLLLEKIGEYDMVCGWRHRRNDPWIKRVSSKIANAVRNRLSEENIADTGCSLKAFRRECLRDLKLFNGMHRFFPTLVKLRGFKVTEAKVNHYPRRHGVSKYNIRNRLFSSFLDLLAIRWMKKRRLNYQICSRD